MLLTRCTTPTDWDSRVSAMLASAFSSDTLALSMEGWNLERIGELKRARQAFDKAFLLHELRCFYWLVLDDMRSRSLQGNCISLAELLELWGYDCIRETLACNGISITKYHDLLLSDGIDWMQVEGDDCLSFTVS